MRWAEVSVTVGRRVPYSSVRVRGSLGKQFDRVDVELGSDVARKRKALSESPWFAHFGAWLTNP